MRKVTFGAANSLDNYIARPDGAVDWLFWNKEVQKIVAEFWRTIDTVVMGRKTYEPALKQGAGGDGSVNPYPGVKTYVFSRTLPPTKNKAVEIISEDAAAFLRKLKKKKGKDICVMGGGELAKSLFEAGLIDEVGVNIHPVLLGSGIPMFHELSRQIDLELIECKTLKTGCVMITYRVKH